MRQRTKARPTYDGTTQQPVIEQERSRPRTRPGTGMTHQERPPTGGERRPTANPLTQHGPDNSKQQQPPPNRERNRTLTRDADTATSTVAESEPAPASFTANSRRKGLPAPCAVAGNEARRTGVYRCETRDERREARETGVYRCEDSGTPLRPVCRYGSRSEERASVTRTATKPEAGKVACFVYRDEDRCAQFLTGALSVTVREPVVSHCARDVMHTGWANATPGDTVITYTQTTKGNRTMTTSITNLAPQPPQTGRIVASELKRAVEYDHYLVAPYNSSEEFYWRIIVVVPDLASPCWVTRTKRSKIRSGSPDLVLAVPSLDDLDRYLLESLTGIANAFYYLYEFRREDRVLGRCRRGDKVAVFR